MMIERRPTVSVEQLHTFAAVARTGHITRAAEAIHLSQGAVSQQVQRLEASLGVSLIERVGRGIRLTEAGRAVGAAAGGAIAAISAVESTAAAFRGLGVGGIAIAASNTVGIHRAPAWLAGYLDAHPAVRVRLRLGNSAAALGDLAAGEVDLALVEGAVRPDGVDTLLLERDELLLVAAAGHPLAALRRVGDGDLRGHRYLAREDGSGTEALAREVVGAAYRTGPVLELGHLEAVRAGVAAGLGYAVLPRTVVAGALDAGDVAVLARDGRSTWREFRAVRRGGFSTPALDAMWAHLTTIAATTATAPDSISPGRPRRAPGPRRRRSR